MKSLKPPPHDHKLIYLADAGGSAGDEDDLAGDVFMED